MPTTNLEHFNRRFLNDKYDDIKVLNLIDKFVFKIIYLIFSYDQYVVILPFLALLYFLHLLLD